MVKIDARKIESFKRLLLGICVSNPLEITMEKLAKTVGITKPTLYKYITYLSRAELLHHILFDAKRFQNLKKPDKLYLNNTNLFNAQKLQSDQRTAGFLCRHRRYRDRVWQQGTALVVWVFVLIVAKS